ncbi:MEMAR_RS02690 family S-layer glycoprotein [Methanoculleus sp. 7T]|uniref:MEMAR_RS02690 family S-layer glycoprotein n=1 Tax=Methanoculleus sp. 7T TaxID=2937282 RepID=UPI0020C11237|nr:MEMAR_RS02690 family S-layer glycoprotein [Methanoculleus sp. 7T]MCK8518044.1 PGF-CTERM sorting domain-containing protein [Methanoculleus sp. 7T]
MKSMTKLMVVAMLLVAALVVAPAAAARVINTNGTTVYVGEENINFASSTGTGGFGTLVKVDQLVHYSDPSAGAIDKTILADKNGNVTELTKSAIGTTTGTYYVFADGADTGSRNNAAGSVNVQYPEATLDVVLSSSPQDSVNGKSVTRDNKLDFKLTNNLNGLKQTSTYGGATMNIEVTLPGGGVTTQFGGVTNLKDVTVDGTTMWRGPIDLTNAEAGTYSAVAKWPSGSDFYGKGFDSKAVTFEVLTKKLAISANKDTVVRDNSFTVTITGESKQSYFLFVKDVGLAENQYPLIAPGQNGVKNETFAYFERVNGKLQAKAGKDPLTNVDLTTVPGLNYTQAWVETNAGGTRSIQFNTSTTTDDRQFTIRVQDLKDKGTYDEVKVKVEKGEVTVTASGTGVYYIGEEVTLSGTNTDSKYVYLFLTGPNLGTNGVKLDDTRVKTKTGTENSVEATQNFTRVSVEADDTWSYKWDTSSLGQVIDAGGYTVYAVAQPVSKDDLGDNKYATVGVNLKSAFITATASSATIAKGDKLTITGTAQGNPSSVNVWIFGKNKRELAKGASVESDGSFEYKLESGETKDLTAGQYFVVVQHPMSKGFGVRASGTSIVGDGINSVDLANLQASDAATALVNALDSPNVDDTYTKLTFVVEEPNIFIDPIGDKEAGSKFTISGTTNLAVGDKLIIDVTSAAFQPTKKTEASGFASASGTVTVEKGDGMNKWSFEVDAASFKPDQYIVKIESVETGTTQTANFNVVEPKPTTQPTGTATTQPTGTATTATTTAPATTPTQSPGFGALVALAGLGAVAFLVLRRN